MAISFSQSVVTIGSNMKGHGGIASLLRSYSKIYCPFNYIRTTCSGDFIKRTLVYLWSVVKLIVWLARPSVKLVHIHSSSFILHNKSAVYVFVSKIMGKKVVLHLHGGALSEECRRYELFLRRLFKYVDRVVCVSCFVESVVKSYRLSSSTSVIYNILEKPSLKRLPKCNGGVVFLFMGNICEEKGVFDVIDVIIKHKEYFEGRAIFNIAGGGEIERLDGLVRRNHLENVVRYVGWIDGDEKSTHLNQSDVYIQPTYFESLGISILEAMSYSLPVISTNVGGVPEIVSDGVNGFLIDPKDKNALFEKMKFLVEHKDKRTEMGQAGADFVSAFYAESIEKQLQALYQSLL